MEVQRAPWRFRVELYWKTRKDYENAQMWRSQRDRHARRRPIVHFMLGPIFQFYVNLPVIERGQAFFGLQSSSPNCSTERTHSKMNKRPVFLFRNFLGQNLKRCQSEKRLTSTPFCSVYPVYRLFNFWPKRFLSGIKPLTSSYLPFLIRLQCVRLVWQSPLKWIKREILFGWRAWNCV